MKPLAIEEATERELAGSVDFYEDHSPGLGWEFERAAREAVRRIQADPERHPLQQDGTRRCVMARFPFTIRYLDLPNCIWIVAFAHTSRKPGYWKARLRSRL